MVPDRPAPVGAADLHPAAAAMLAAAPARPSLHRMAPARARRVFDAEAAAPPGEPVARVEELRVAVEGGTIPARLYRPASERLPVVVFAHGGGWVVGSVDSHDALCRALANASGAAIVSVGYRLAPEHPFPTAARDIDAAVRWAVAQADALGLDGDRLALAGDSAGGNLALAAAVQARDRGGPPIAFSLLAYPVLSTDLDRTLDADFDGLVITREELAWQQDQYLPDRATRRDPLAAPLDAADLRGLPRTLLLAAACDPLRPQAERGAAALAAAGVAVDLRICAGMPHGFLQHPAVLGGARAALREAGDALRTALAAVGSAQPDPSK